MLKVIITGPYPGHPGAHMAHFNHNNHSYYHSHDLNHYHPNNNHNNNHMTGSIQQPFQAWGQPMVPFTPFMF